ncbi:hypothetical protein JZ751_004796 [Albula glossodonta]|uniref:Prospero domain-containing protein n=1 Tax=Albula glossodonta TaxID=121402 RepID=A0A8T2P4L2_9TELE|nr:hypothetical protein JZ751_004796 [Albula glossodonta]
MFFYARYPSSNMLKMFFSDVKSFRPHPPTPRCPLAVSVAMGRFWGKNFGLDHRCLPLPPTLHLHINGTCHSGGAMTDNELI